MIKQANQYGFGNSPVEQEKKDRKKLVNIFMFVFIFFCLLGGMYYGLNLTCFEIKHIECRGNVFLSETELNDLYKVFLGINIWKLNLGQAREEGLTHPRIAAVKAERSLPDTLKIIIEERETVALIYYQSHFYELARDGILMDTRDSLVPGDYPIITEMVGLSFLPGENVTAVEGGVRLLTLLETLRGKELEISEINVKSPDNLVVIDISGKQVWLGRNDYAQKIDLIMNIISSWPEKAVYLDFRVLTAPTFVMDIS